MPQIRNIIRRFIFSFAALASFVFCAAANSEGFSFTYALGRNTGTGFEPFRNTALYILAYSKDHLDFRTGWQQTEATFDYTVDSTLWLWNFKSKRGFDKKLGVGFLYHYFLFEEISSAHDFQAAFHWKLQITKGFSTDGDFGVQLKKEHVFAIGGTTPYLTNWNPALRFRFTYSFVFGLDCYFEMASYEYFRYMLFFSPAYTFGARYAWSNGLYLGGELVPRYTDQFTLSAYFDCAEARLYFGFNF